MSAPVSPSACAVQEEVLSWVKGVGVIARGLLHCPQATAQLFADAQAQGVRRIPKGQPPSAAPPAASGAALLATFLADVADNFDCIAQPADRKLAAMAAAAALTLPAPEVLEHVEALAVAMTGVWEALEGGGNDFPGEYAWIGADPGDYFPTSEMPVCLSEDAQGAAAASVGPVFLVLRGACSMRQTRGTVASGTAVLDLTRYAMPYAYVRRREQRLWVAAVRARGSVGFGHPCNMALTHRVGVGWVPRSPGRPGRALLPRGRFHGDLTARLKQHYISKHIWNCWPSCAFKNASSLVFVGTTAEQGRSDLDPLKASVHTPTCPKH